MNKFIVVMVSLLTIGSTSIDAKRKKKNNDLNTYKHTSQNSSKYEKYNSYSEEEEEDNNSYNSYSDQEEDNPYEGMTNLFDENNYQPTQRKNDHKKAFNDTKNNVQRKGRETIDQTKKAFNDSKQQLKNKTDEFKNKISDKVNSTITGLFNGFNNLLTSSQPPQKETTRQSYSYKKSGYDRYEKGNPKKHNR